MSHQSTSPSSGGNNLNKVLKDFILGGTSGAIAKTVAAPIERVKLLLQTQHNNPKLMERPYTGNSLPIQALSTASTDALKRKASFPSGEATGQTS
jgi:solute carrier family 25 (adenine nucleotide translocator) protein 4/5/6/31